MKKKSGTQRESVTKEKTTGAFSFLAASTRASSVTLPPLGMSRGIHAHLICRGLELAAAVVILSRVSNIQGNMDG